MADEILTDISNIVGEGGDVPLCCLPDASGWVPHGRCVAYRDDGRLHIEITYDNGIANGPYRDYWSNGRLGCEGDYVDGLQEGEWRFYHQDGRLMEVIRFEGGREVTPWR